MDPISVLLLAILLAIVPTVLYAALLWWLDRYEKEPIPLLLIAFVWGAVPATIIAILLELGAGIPLEQIIITNKVREITEAILIAPFVEEAVKAIILVVLFRAFWREFDDVLDGIIYGAMVGLGFSLVENVLYLRSAALDDLNPGDAPDIGRMLGLWLLRGVLFGLNHSMFTAFTGAALGFARSLKLRWQRGLVPSLGLGTGMIFHGLHNSLASAISVLPDGRAGSSLVIGACLGIFVSDWGGLLLIVAVAVLSGVNEGRVISQTLLEEVALGRFTPDEYATLISGRKRWSIRWSTLFSSGIKRWRQMGKFFDLSTELAFRKHCLPDGDPIHQNILARDIARLRNEIDNLKMAIIFSS